MADYPDHPRIAQTLLDQRARINELEEQLARTREEMRAELREAHGTLKDLRAEIKTARELVPLLTDELFMAEVKKQVDQLAEATEAAMAASVDKVTAQFDRLTDTLMGQNRQQRRKGQPSIPDLAGQYAARRHGKTVVADQARNAAVDRGEHVHTGSAADGIRCATGHCTTTPDSPPSDTPTQETS